MILFAGIPSEDPLRLAIEAAIGLDIDHVVLNQRHAAHVDLALAMGEDGIEGTLWIAGERHPLAAFTGIYARTVAAGTLPEMGGTGRSAIDPAIAARTEALTRLFDDWLDIAPARVVNRPAAMGSNMSKPYQAQLIQAAGFRTPETLVTDDPDAVRAFHAEHGEIIYKSASGIRSIVHRWSPRLGPDLAAIAALPTQFQAFVPGENIRVHVIGTRLFATRIASDAVDYRYAGQDGLAVSMMPIELPTGIAKACVELAASLGLPLAGIDLKRGDDGIFYCFEVNPAPAYSYFEQQARQPIAEAIALFLAGAD